MSIAISALLALSIPANGYLCPATPEPSPLASANFEMPAQGTSISIGASASFQRTRFAIHIARPKPGGLVDDDGSQAQARMELQPASFGPEMDCSH
ncbi:MAG: hypothetical protein ABIP07_08180 [Sphingomicrobium sp.]